MQQVLFQIPGTSINIYGFGLMLFLAFLAAMTLASRRAKRAGLDPDIIYDLAFWMILFGLVGARLFYVIQHQENIKSFADAFRIWEGGIVLYGSLIGAGVGFGIYWWRRRFPVLRVLDVIAPAIALGVAIGRVGCFLNGCCYGDLCDPSQVPWAVQFPAGTLPWHDHFSEGLIPREQARSLPIHPTQVYSTINGLLLTALLLAFSPLKRRHGQVLALLLTTYPISRFLIEQIRDDEGAIFAGMTISQNVSILVFLFGIGFWLALSRQPKIADQPAQTSTTEPEPSASAADG